MISYSRHTCGTKSVFEGVRLRLTKKEMITLTLSNLKKYTAVFLSDVFRLAKALFLDTKSQA